MTNQATARISPLGNMGLFVRKGTCSETVFHVLNRAYGHPMPDEERASIPLAGGLLMQGYQCGQIWGAALAAGAQAYRVCGAGAQAQARAILAAGAVVEAFRTRSEHTDCFDIAELSGKPSKLDLLKVLARGRYVRCFRIIARFPQLAVSAIDAVLGDEGVEAPPAPVGCAAAIARRLGASDLHTVMAAGLAGGIGLSGGGCGALAAAVWLTTLDAVTKHEGKIGFKMPGHLAMLDRFLKASNYEFECATIVGRGFESVGDHARYVCEGGCSKILDALAAA